MRGSAGLVFLLPNGHPVEHSDSHKEDAETGKKLTQIDQGFQVCLPFACRTCTESDPQRAPSLEAFCCTLTTHQRPPRREPPTLADWCWVHPLRSHPICVGVGVRQTALGFGVIDAGILAVKRSPNVALVG